MNDNNKKPKSLSWGNKEFLALNITQALGALNDNAFKMMVTLLIVDLIVNPQIGSRYVSLVSAVFVIPFILFSTFAGFLADRFSKRTVLIYSKAMEIAVMGIGVLALYLKSVPFMIATLFFMALQSTFFGPAKYGILPEMLDSRELSNANGILNLYTFLAIILGTVTGGIFLHITKPDYYLAGFGFVLIAVLGTISSFFITDVPPAACETRFDWNPVRQFYRDIKDVSKNRVLFLCILGISYFWFIGSIFQIDILLYGKNLMNISNTGISIFLAVLAIGMGFGSGLAGKMSADQIELGFVPLGSLGMGIFSLDLVSASYSSLRVGTDLFFLGTFAGFFVVPLNALLQERSPHDQKGKMIATSNIVSFLGMLIASAAAWFLTDKIGLDPAKTLGVIALIAFGATIYTLRLLPEAFIRLILWLLTHTIYKIKIFGKENVPQKGPALLVVNHLSYVDPLLVGA
ncbi:MAG: MFS transporter [bacterium]